MAARSQSQHVRMGSRMNYAQELEATASLNKLGRLLQSKIQKTSLTPAAFKLPSIWFFHQISFSALPTPQRYCAPAELVICHACCDSKGFVFEMGAWGLERMALFLYGSMLNGLRNNWGSYMATFNGHNDIQVEQGKMASCWDLESLPSEPYRTIPNGERYVFKCGSIHKYIGTHTKNGVILKYSLHYSKVNTSSYAPSNSFGVWGLNLRN